METNRSSFLAFVLNSRAPLFICAALFFTGCANTPPGYVAKEWSATMRELGIIPVFPPREDVLVGDVYIAPVSPDEEVAAFKKKEFLPLGLWLTTLDVGDDVSSFYSSRSSFPTTSSNTADFMSNLTNSPFAGLPQARDGTRNVFLGGDTNRLRMVGFPSFMSATFNKGDLAAVVPVEAVNLAFGAGFSSARSVTISVPVAESYGIPAAKIYGNLKYITSGGQPMDSISGGLSAVQLSRLVNRKQAVRVGTNYYAALRIIHEVYYTRALDISVVSKTTRGLGIAGRPLATDAVSTAASVAAQATSGASSASSSNAPVFIMPGGTNLNGNAVERAGELNRSLEQAMTQTVPGGSIKFVAAGDRGVSLRRTYDRPIAIGYRYIPVLVPIDSPLAPENTWSPTAVGGISYPSPVDSSHPPAVRSPHSTSPDPGTLAPGQVVPPPK